MDEPPAATLPRMRLSGVGQLYVTTVGAVSALTITQGSTAWYMTLVLLSLPLSLLALWLAFYGGLAIGFAVGAEVGDLAWPVMVVWVAVWTATAWVNAQILQKVLRAGWRTVAARPVEDHEED